MNGLKITISTTIDTLPLFSTTFKDLRDWASGKTIGEIWRTCERADWMLWLAQRMGVRQNLLVSCACQIARTTLPFIKDQKSRELAITAIETAEKCIMDNTLENRDAAWVAGEAVQADGYAMWAAGNTMWGVGYAALAAGNTMWGVGYAARAAGEAVDAAGEAAMADDDAMWADVEAARDAAHRKFCAMVRKTISVKTLLNGYHL